MHGERCFDRSSARFCFGTFLYECVHARVCVCVCYLFGHWQVANLKRGSVTFETYAASFGYLSTNDPTTCYSVGVGVIAATLVTYYARCPTGPTSCQLFYTMTDCTTASNAFLSSTAPTVTAVSNAPSSYCGHDGTNANAGSWFVAMVAGTPMSVNIYLPSDTDHVRSELSSLPLFDACDRVCVCACAAHCERCVSVHRPPMLHRCRLLPHQLGLLPACLRCGAGVHGLLRT